MRSSCSVYAHLYMNSELIFGIFRRWSLVCFACGIVKKAIVQVYCRNKAIKFHLNWSFFWGNKFGNVSS